MPILNDISLVGFWPRIRPPGGGEIAGLSASGLSICCSGGSWSTGDEIAFRSVAGEKRLVGAPRSDKKVTSCFSEASVISQHAWRSDLATTRERGRRSPALGGQMSDGLLPALLADGTSTLSAMADLARASLLAVA